MGIKRTTITLDVFTRTKTLLGADLTITQVANLAGISQQSVGRIAKASTFADYKKQRSEAMKAYHAKNTAVAAPADAQQPTPTKPTTAPKSDLARIADALERLADAWEAAPTKKSIFGK